LNALLLPRDIGRRLGGVQQVWPDYPVIEPHAVVRLPLPIHYWQGCDLIAYFSSIRSPLARRFGRRAAAARGSGGARRRAAAADRRRAAAAARGRGGTGCGGGTGTVAGSGGGARRLRQRRAAAAPIRSAPVPGGGSGAPAAVLGRGRRRERHGDASAPSSPAGGARRVSAAFWEADYQQDLARRALQLMQAEFTVSTWKACWETFKADLPTRWPASSASPRTPSISPSAGCCCGYGKN
jgi:hypothetical protein